MMRTLLVRGLAAGVLAGLVAATFSFVVGEPHIDAAIDIEEAGGHPHGGGAAIGAVLAHGDELVSRDLQSTVGLFVAMCGYGLAIGGLFAIAFAVIYGRLGRLSSNGHIAVLAATAFVAVVIVPFLKYPANPPGVGQPGTIGPRTELYFSYLAISLLAAGIALYASRVLADRYGGWMAGTMSAGGYVAVMATCGILTPSVDEVPDGFPASLLWDFRIASLGANAVLWATLAVTFGALAARALAGDRAQAVEDRARSVEPNVTSHP
jgi:hypothetical protein